MRMLGPGRPGRGGGLSTGITIGGSSRPLESWVVIGSMASERRVLNFFRQYYPASLRASLFRRQIPYPDGLIGTDGSQPRAFFEKNEPLHPRRVPFKTCCRLAVVGIP